MASQNDFEVRKLSGNRGLICGGLLRALPEWFGIPSAVENYVREVEALPAFAAFERAAMECVAAGNAASEGAAPGPIGSRAREASGTLANPQAPDDSRAIGFLSLKVHNEATAEIHVMAVHPRFHRHGVGRALLAAAENEARSLKLAFLSVKTLAPSRSNREYDLTRRFYLSTGFLPVEEFETLWGEGNPCLLMLKPI